ncbi:MurR/RpiR family transcriptional regulator [Bifidobacterium miconisargentati]|uniref:MurR/RpiR family transcriptional regulator n=1 Tax=Bifidobacterium miconisargentati TaxID=2834437 RepID=UPI001BDCA917|nr:MurR/RpiR family transcriptional regulator [Bifidobacterium miconisargentati]MBW3089560.1 MurR/RpiR family transcriptional regulator [Bifidobacterium miconisargentati]
MGSKEATQTAPHTYDELRKRLQGNLSAYAPGQARIARLLLDDLPGVAVRSLADNAKKAGVHSSSLVRFAKSLGFEGYPALAHMCREQLSEQAHLIDRFDQVSRIDQIDDDHTQPAHAADDRTPQAAHDLSRDIARTFSTMNPTAWQQAIEALAHTDAVYVCGMQKCFSPAYLLSYLLHMARNHVYLLDSPTGNLLAQIRDINPGDVLVAISIRQYTRQTVQTVLHAKEHGAVIIAITDAPSSPLAAAADYAFFAECEGPYLFRSLVGIIAIAESLAGEVSLKLGEHTRSQLLQDERLIADFGLYQDE